MAQSYDLLIVTDATASMGTYLDSLRKSIPEILTVSRLSGVFERIGIISYKDYCDYADEIICWSGWNSPDLLEFVDQLKPTGGGDFPEAAKTALIRALQEVKRGGTRRTLVLWYTDAPPHHPAFRSYENDKLEAKAYPNEGATDWVKLSLLAAKMNLTVFSFVPSSMDNNFSSFYVLLSQLTGGLCVSSNIESSLEISRLTLETVLQWMGQGADIDARLAHTNVNFLQFETKPVFDKPKSANETDGAQSFLPPPLGKSAPELRPIIKSRLRASDIPLTPTPVPLNLAKQYNDPANSEYRAQVYDSLTTIIESNIHALTYNNVFGQLWRAVCARASPEQAALLNAFSKQVGAIRDPGQKRALQDWLEESFDSTAKIEDIIAAAKPDGPAAYLDLDADVKLTRTELLEVSRSCYSGVLKRLASIFTHLKLVEPNVKLVEGQSSIPLSLEPNDFFRVLPHLVVPGTLYPPRSASIMAILALVTSVPFLQEKATTLLQPLKGTWIDLEVPENLSFDAAKFLLSSPEGIVLTDKERQVYAAMRRYRLIELNLETTIHVKAPWTPDKTKDVGDEKVECQSCHIRRSVTLMSEQRKNVCGLCIEGPSAVDFPDNGEASSHWVECADKSCRAQYVVENVSALNVRPKCWYCRNRKPCPWLECAKCSNRVIVPTPYRKKGKYFCPGCKNENTKINTITTSEATPQLLIKENGLGWLGLESKPDLMMGKSAFKLMTAHGTSVFDAKPSKSITLTFNSKKVLYPEEALVQVEHWVGTGEVELGSCSLCFDDKPKNKLLPACGRKGCKQRADTECLNEWYSKCEPGKLLNVMQLACPFCRRKPDHRTLSRYNPRAMALGGLKDALEDRAFFYAWCLDCGFAKQAFERVCCGDGRLPPVQNFRCPDCIHILEQQALEIEIAEEEAERQRVGAQRQADRDAIEQRRRAKNLPKRKVRVTPCPTCATYVEKIEGCNHITCICGTHFCHVCGAGGKKWSAGDIYEHMDQEHGGCFGADYDEDEDEDA